MIKREFKVNLKSFIIWASILVGIFLFVFLIYPYIINEDTVKELDNMMNSFPPDILKAFNMDISSLTEAYGWVKSEGVTFILLIIGFYSSLLGSSILLKEESDKTIEYLSSLPISRNKILTNKIIVGITYVISLILIIGLFDYIALLLSGDFDQKQYFLFSIAPLFIALPLFAINLFISTFLHKTKKSIGITLGLVFIFYIINVMSELSDKVEFLKYFTIYTLADIRNIIINISIRPIYIIVSLLITILFIAFTYIRYNKKELLN